MLHGLFFCATIVLTLLSVLPLWRCQAWWVRDLDFPRLQLALIALALVIGGFLALDLSLVTTWVSLAALSLCFCYQAWWIAPYTMIFPREVVSAPTGHDNNVIKIITANVLTSNRNAEALLGLVHDNDPDILVTLESDIWWQSRLDTLLPYYPYSVKCPLDNLYGMHVYAKLKLTNSHIKYLVDQEIPSIHSLVHLPSGQKIRLHFLHPTPPSPTQNGSSKDRDAELIIFAKSVAEADVPIIVTGDLNDVAWSETTRLFRKISGLLDPRVGRGMYNTYNAKYWFMRWPLDHLFHSDHFMVRRICRLDKFGSDHFALLTELVYTCAAAKNDAGLTADSDDKKQAKEKINNSNAAKKDVPEPEKQ